MMRARRDRTIGRATDERTAAARLITVGVLAIALIGVPMVSEAQSLAKRAVISPAAAGSGQAPGGCPAWLSEPYIVEALRQAEPQLAQKLGNKIATAQLLNTRALAGRDVLFNEIRSELRTGIYTATVRNSSSPRLHDEAGERTSFFEQMSFETMTACLPRFAKVLAEAEGQVADADRAEADREAEARTPKGRMLTVYGSYAALKACLRSRAGRLLTYVTKDDVDEARSKAKAIEHQLLRDEPSLDVGALWGEATKPVATSTDLLTLAFDPDMVGRYDVDQGEFTEHGKAYCQRARRRIEGVYGELFVDADKPKKDF